MRLTDFLQLLKATHQRGWMNSQNARGVGFVLPGGVQHVFNVAVLQFAQGDELVAGRLNIIDREWPDLR